MTFSGYATQRSDRYRPHPSNWDSSRRFATRAGVASTPPWRRVTLSARGISAIRDAPRVNAVR